MTEEEKQRIEQANTLSRKLKDFMNNEQVTNNVKLNSIYEVGAALIATICDDEEGLVKAITAAKQQTESRATFYYLSKDETLASKIPS